MKVIDKRTKKTNEDYNYGDILMCWDKEPDKYDLFRISAFYDSYYKEYPCIVVTIHSISGNESKTWAGLYHSPKEAARDLKNSYNHVEKVNTYIVITD